MKTSLTKAEYWQLIGLLALAEHHCSVLNDITQSVTTLLGTEDNEYVLDIVWSGNDIGANAFLKRVGVTVDEEAAEVTP